MKCASKNNLLQKDNKTIRFYFNSIVNILATFLKINMDTMLLKIIFTSNERVVRVCLSSRSAHCISYSIYTTGATYARAWKNCCQWQKIIRKQILLHFSQIWDITLNNFNISQNDQIVSIFNSLLVCLLISIISFFSQFKIFYFFLNLI